MSDLIVMSFDTDLKAEKVRLELLEMQREHLVDLEDAVVVVRDADGRIKLRQLHHLTASSAIGGGFWGTLVGLLFLSPLFGLAVGAAAGAVAGALTDVGIEDRFMKELGETLEPGTSALCVLARKVTGDKVVEALRPFEGKLLRTSLSHEDERRLRQALAGQDAIRL